jgi:hypothetical protein
MGVRGAERGQNEAQGMRLCLGWQGVAPPTPPDPQIVDGAAADVSPAILTQLRWRC